VYHWETAADIDFTVLKGKKRAGLTAGTSTPDWIIEEVFNIMSDFESKDLTLETTEIKEVEFVKKDEDNAIRAESLPGDYTDGISRDEYSSAEIAEKNIADGAKNEETCVAAEENSEESISPDNDETKMDESFEYTYGYDMKKVRRGARVKGTVVQVKRDELLVDIGGKSEGILSASELVPEEAANILQKFAADDEIEVLILKKENKEGYPVLSKKRVDQEVAWEKLYAVKKENGTISGKVTEVVKGGLLINLGVRGFIPASLVALGRVKNLNSFVGKEITVKIVDCDRGANRLVLSARAVLEENARRRRNETVASIEEGQTKRGVVCRLTSFGAFVDIGGVDGLLHVSEMAWHRVRHPADILKVGDELDVYILKIDRENEKVSLGLKQLIPNPWSLAEEKYTLGSIVSAKVVRMAPFGAFLEVEPGVEGLAHISQLARFHVKKPEEVLSSGQIVNAKVLAVDGAAKRMSLSVKDAPEIPGEESDSAAAPYEEETDNTVVPPAEESGSTAVSPAEESDSAAAPYEEETDNAVVPPAEESSSAAVSPAEESDSAAAPYEEETDNTVTPSAEESDSAAGIAPEE
jgi:4-hydroxy-3-methylbut-2-enyl diphosphate reductase